MSSVRVFERLIRNRLGPAILFLVGALIAPTMIHAQGTDLVFVMDGSGSISSADFALQKQGIIAALNNSQVFPRDGSIAFTLVQFGNRTTRVEVPFTIIDDESDVTNIKARINSFGQIRSLTNVGQGIDRGMQVVNASGRPAAQQSVCLSTDGLNNSGPHPSGVIGFWKTNGIRMDRFGVIAIEDPPFYFEPDFVAEYGGLVFGGGAVTVVQSAVEYANTVGLSCLADPVRLIGLEVNQAVQDWNNSVPLVRNKQTLVRAHIETIDMNPSAPAAARLRGFRGGAELPGSPLTAINAGGQILAMPNAAARRGNLNDSLNFRLPLSWRRDTVELRIEGVGTAIDCSEAASTPDDCAATVTFEDVDDPEIKFVKVSWTNAAGNTLTPSDARVRELARRFNAIFPTDRVDWNSGSTSVSGSPPDLDDVNSRLESIRFWDLCWGLFGCDRIYYGVLDGPPDLGGLANGIPGTVSSGTMPMANFTYGRNRHAHEVAHDLARHHATSSALGRCTNRAGNPIAGTQRGPCGSCASSSAPNFPYISNVGGNQRATLGPMGAGEDSLIYGWDSHSSRIVDPNNTFELMSYCPGWRWISKFTYGGVKNALNATFDAPPAERKPTDHMVVRGTIDLTSDAVSLLPFSTVVSGTSPPQMPAGDYTVRVLDSSLAIIEEHDFQPIVFGQDIPAGGTPEEPDLTGFFIVPIDNGAAASEIQVIKDGTVLAMRARSSGEPTTVVMSPNGGELLDEPLETISWSATDLDENGLTYIVQYTYDGGANWITLGMDLTETSFDVDMTVLPGGTNSSIRVIASDGFSSSTDTSDGVFEVPNRAPRVEIFAPFNGESFFGTQIAVFSGEAFDLEEGLIDPATLQWISDIDGLIGTGAELEIDVSTLTEGQHEVTLRAQDSNGAVGAATVVVGISVIAVLNEPPVANAGDDVAVECTGPDGAQVTLNGSASTDADSSPGTNDDIVSFEWTEDGALLGASEVVQVGFGLGNHDVILKVTDSFGETDTDDVHVSVGDNTAPVVTAQFATMGISFPMAQLSSGRFTIEFDATDTCDTAPRTEAVLSNGCEDIRVTHGQVVDVQVGVECKAQWTGDRILQISGSTVELSVTGTDASMNASTTTVGLPPARP